MESSAQKKTSSIFRVFRNGSSIFTTAASHCISLASLNFGRTCWRSRNRAFGRGDESAALAVKRIQSLKQRLITEEPAAFSRRRQWFAAIGVRVILFGAASRTYRAVLNT